MKKEHSSALIKETRRDALRMSVNQFASVLGVTPRAVRQWESGERVPSKTIAKLIRALIETRLLKEEILRLNESLDNPANRV